MPDEPLEGGEEDKAPVPSLFDQAGFEKLLAGLDDDDPEDGEDDIIGVEDVSEEDKAILDEFKGSPAEVAKAYRNLRDLQSRQATELGELRAKVAEIEKAPASEAAASDENSVYRTNEFGVKYIPDEAWTTPEFLDSVVQGLVAQGYPEDQAKMLAPIRITQSYTAHKTEVARLSMEAMQGTTAAEEEEIKALVPQQEQAMADAEAALSETLSITYDDETVEAIITEAVNRAKADTRARFEAGEITLRQATDPAMVGPAYNSAMASMLSDGTFKKIVAGPGGSGVAMRAGVAPATTGRAGSQVAPVRQQTHASTAWMSAEDAALFKSLRSLGLTEAQAIENVKKAGK